eukprot:gnl/Dysnectes_brevis/669_a737_542.p1 GENE.gnl/Dysnectes_brevis/669_a737_542~~gnl/Dysnectes_brevis/669_a737_542.p1  ORF type:complete len:740 (+),score=125.24 gnl/Dysnectes_brevis/669_a737_542:199-2418(+)
MDFGIYNPQHIDASRHIDFTGVEHSRHATSNPESTIDPYFMSFSLDPPSSTRFQRRTQPPVRQGTFRSPPQSTDIKRQAYPPHSQQAQPLNTPVSDKGHHSTIRSPQTGGSTSRGPVYPSSALSPDPFKSIPDLNIEQIAHADSSLFSQQPVLGHTGGLQTADTVSQQHSVMSQDRSVSKLRLEMLVEEYQTRLDDTSSKLADVTTRLRQADFDRQQAILERDSAMSRLSSLPKMNQVKIEEITTRLDDAKADLVRVRTELGETRSKYDSMKEQNQDLTTRISEMVPRADYSRVKEENARATRQTLHISTSISRLESAIRILSEQNNLYPVGKEDTSSEDFELVGRILAVLPVLVEASSELGAKTRRVSELERVVDSMHVEELKGSISVLRTRLAQTNSELVSSREALEGSKGEIESLEVRLRTCSCELVSSKRVQGSMNSELLSLRKSQTSNSRRIRELEGELSESRTRELEARIKSTGVNRDTQTLGKDPEILEAELRTCIAKNEDLNLELVSLKHIEDEVVIYRRQLEDAETTRRDLFSTRRDLEATRIELDMALRSKTPQMSRQESAVDAFDDSLVLSIPPLDATLLEVPAMDHSLRVKYDTSAENRHMSSSEEDDIDIDYLDIAPLPNLDVPEDRFNINIDIVGSPLRHEGVATAIASPPVPTSKPVLLDPAPTDDAAREVQDELMALVARLQTTDVDQRGSPPNPAVSAGSPQSMTAGDIVGDLDLLISRLTS